MTVESHLAELQKRHQAMDLRIADEERRPAKDQTNIAAMKRQKLSLKDEIERLRKESVRGRPN